MSRVDSLGTLRSEALRSISRTGMVLKRVELATEVFDHQHKAATSLGIDIQRMKDATSVINNASIRSGRHRGQEVVVHGDPDPAESQLCEGVAEQIVGETRLVQMPPSLQAKLLQVLHVENDQKRQDDAFPWMSL